MNIIKELEKNTNIQYVAVRLSQSSKNKVELYLKENKIKNPITKDKMHVTVMYSTTIIDMKDALLDKKIKEYLIPLKFNIWKTQDGANGLVVEMESEYLKKRHFYWKERNGKPLYPEFKVHLSLSYNVGDDFDLSALDIDKFPIVDVVEEYAEPLNLNFAKEP